MCVFGEMSIEVFFPFFNWVIFIIVVELYELLDSFGNQALVCHIICKYFLPFCRFSFFFLLINFWLCWVFVAAQGLLESRDLLFVRCAGFSLPWLVLLRNMGSRHMGFSSFSTPGSLVVARWL